MAWDDLFKKDETDPNQLNEEDLLAMGGGISAEPEISPFSPVDQPIIPTEEMGMEATQLTQPEQPPVQPEAETTVVPPQKAMPEWEKYIRGKYGVQSGMDDQALQEAQQKARKGELFAGVMEGVDTAAAAIAGTDPKTKFYERLRQQAQRPVEELAVRRAGKAQELEGLAKGMTVEAAFSKMAASERASDPKSLESKNARTLLKQLSPESAKDPNFESMTASEVENAIKVYKIIEDAKLRKTLAELKVGEARTKTREAAETKDELQTNKDFMRLGEKVEGSIASSRSAFGRNANNMRSAGAILVLVNQIKERQGGKPDQRQMFEIVRSLDQMFSQGMGTITGAKELMPTTAAQKYATLKEFISGSPANAEIADFLKRTEDTVKREQNYAQGQLSSVKTRLAGGYTHLYKKDPERYKDLFNQHDLDVDEKGFPVAREATPKTETPPPPAGTLDEDKKKRLEELRRKREGK